MAEFHLKSNYDYEMLLLFSHIKYLYLTTSIEICPTQLNKSSALLQDWFGAEDANLEDRQM